jgi:membrane protein YqaA with SNARE-associated domain
MSFFKQLSQYLIVLGIPGLFFIVLLDSVAIPLPGGPDALVILLAWQKPALFLWIGIVAALGSTIGCLILYKIGHTGGALAMARMTSKRQEWVKRKIEQNSFLAVFLAVLVPPPFPTKAVILAAGVLRIPIIPFGIAVLLGRLTRYVATAYLAAHLGNRTASVIRSHYPAILLGIVGIAVLFLAGRHLLRRAEKQSAGNA